MARTRNRRGAAGTQRRKFDWTYTDRAYNPNSSVDLVAGPVGIMIPLSYSDNALKIATAGPTGLTAAIPVAGVWQSWAALPERGSPRCHAVEGWVSLSPASWTVGQEFHIVWRLMHQLMDNITNNFLLTVPYSIFGSITGNTPAQWANAGFLKEWVMREANITGTAVSSRGAWLQRIQWRSKKGITMPKSNALGLYGEAAGGSITTRCRPMLRSLWSTEL